MRASCASLLQQRLRSSRICVNGGSHSALSMQQRRAQSSTKSFKRRWISTGGKVVLGGSVLVGLGWIAASDNPSQTTKLLYAVPVRVARDVVTVATIVADYKYSLYNLSKGTAEREVSKREAHLRSADRLQALCFKNGGIYIKLGQHLGQLDYLLPQEYVQAMRKSMLDKCPTSSYKQVCDVFLTELGRLPHEIFAEFDRVPLASASLAQVHAARTRDGQKVAVKVQHMHLIDSAAADTATVDIFVNLLHWFIPTFDYRWLLAEIKENIPKELDFLNEAKNAEDCVHNFHKHSPKVACQIAVPKIDYKLSTSKVLVMEFMEGVRVTDVASIKKLGLRPVDVAQLISQAFAEMIFHHGFVHCDPHAANMMVRTVPSSSWNPLGWWKKKPQLVLLDHGYYKNLSPGIRANYAGLWKALVFANATRIKEYGVRLGAGEDLYVLFAGVLTMRPWDRIVISTMDHLKVPDTAEERAEIQMYAAQYWVEVSELLRRLPRVVLLLLKTNDCLRAVDNALGAPVNTFVITAREASRALTEIERSKGSRLSYCVSLLERIEVELKLWGLQVMSWLANFSKYAALPKV